MDNRTVSRIANDAIAAYIDIARLPLDAAALQQSVRDVVTEHGDPPPCDMGRVQHGVTMPCIGPLGHEGDHLTR